MTNFTPNNIQQELNTLSNNLNGIKSSMINMGITISSNDDLSTYGDKLTSKNTELVSANTTLQQEKAQLQSDNNSLTQTNATLTTQNQNLTSANATLTSQNNELTQANTTLTSQNESLTTENNSLTNQNNELTIINETLSTNNTELNGYLTNIRTALINQGIVTNEDSYSVYADKIGEAEMSGSYEKVLINNGTNGWYLIDRKTNWVKLWYTCPNTGWTSSTEHVFSTTNSWYYYKAITLPVTFIMVKPHIRPYWYKSDTVPLNSIETFEVVDCTEVPMTLTNVHYNYYNPFSSIRAFVLDTNMNKVYFVNKGYDSDAQTKGTLNCYIEGMIA